MKASFDEIRLRLAISFNNLALTQLTEEQIPKMENLRSLIAGLLCMYDDSCPDDCNDLSAVARLCEVVKKNKN